MTNYAPERPQIGTKRYSRDEMAEMRSGVRMTFDAPKDGVLERLVRTFERIQGRVARPDQVNYLIRLHRIHGPSVEVLLLRLYRERGSTANLLLAVELAPPAWLEPEDPEPSIHQEDPRGDGGIDVVADDASFWATR